MRRTAITLALAVLLASPNRATTSPSCPSTEHARAADRVAAAFDRRPFVLFGSTHGGVKRHEFLLCLLSRAAFVDAVTDIVVEFAAASRQDLLDRYLIDLELSPEELRPIVMDSDEPRLWATLPQVSEFLLAVRAVNERLDRPKRIRVLGGSETVVWSRVDSVEDLAPFPYKTNHTAHLITAHLAPDPEARALVVYGDAHIQRGGTLTGDIEAVLDPARLYVVGTITTLKEGERDLVAELGDPEHAFFVAKGDFPTTERLPDGLFYADPGALAEKVDAVVYLGPTPDRNLHGALELSDAEQQELARRDAFRRAPNSLEIRYGGKRDGLWFADHPNDIPADPR